MSHTPVLLKEVIEVLDPKEGDFVIDGTANGGGHAEEILRRVGASGKLLALDWDEGQVRALEARLGKTFPNAIFACGNYADLPELLAEKKLSRAQGLLLDLGFSSNQLEGGRGFSFQHDEPLLMTYGNAKPVREILARIREEDLSKIIKEFGEERHAVAIARAIVKYRSRKPITTTRELRDVVLSAVPRGYERGRIDPATRTFQALRIYANGELENLQSAFEELPEILAPGGRAAVVSFHSLEDRIVKRAFAAMKQAGKVQVLTKKPVTASEEEIGKNPRSRSAKLRAAALI